MSAGGRILKQVKPPAFLNAIAEIRESPSCHSIRRERQLGKGIVRWLTFQYPTHVVSALTELFLQSPDKLVILTLRVFQVVVS